MNERSSKSSRGEEGDHIREREVSYQAKKFVVYLPVAHKQSQHRIQQLLSSGGGYILHLDATCEVESPHLMCGLDGIMEIVLENAKLSSKNAEEIIPFLKKDTTSLCRSTGN